MKFGIILSVDVHADEDLLDCLPDVAQELEETENDESEYDFYEGGEHRKFVGVLTREQFDELIEYTEMQADTVETMGALGVPWSPSGLGWAPAISFSSTLDGSVDMQIYDAYVTPLPRVAAVGTKRDWERIRAAVISVYGS